MFKTEYYRDDKGVIKAYPKIMKIDTHQRIICTNSLKFKKRKSNKS